MTKRDFFRVIIKLFGLYAATIAMFSLLPTYIGYAISEFESTNLWWILGTIVVILLLLALLIFGADKIIKLLDLDKGFDDEQIDFGNFKEINLLKLATIILGGIMIIDNFPSFVNHSYRAFKSRVSSNELTNMIDSFAYERVDYFQFAVSVISILIGYLMITNYTHISEWLLKSDKKNSG